MKLLIGVGFSRGWAELTPKKPPPLVPSCLIATWEAAGPSAIVWVPPSRVVTVAAPSKVWTTPSATRIMATTSESGSRMYSVERVRSAQKLPTPGLCRRVRPRISATRTAMPVAADTKFCTVNPSIWTA